MTERAGQITGQLFPDAPPTTPTLERAIRADERWSTMQSRRAPQPAAAPNQIGDPELPLHIYDQVMADFQRRKDQAVKVELREPTPSWFPSPDENTVEAEPAEVPSQGRHALRVPAAERVTDVVIEGRPGEYTVASHVAPLAAGALAANLRPTAGSPENTAEFPPLSATPGGHFLGPVSAGFSRP